MTSLRVLMSCERFAPVIGGLERQALLLARGLAARGVGVEVVTRRLHGLPSEAVVDGIPVHRVRGIHAMGPARVSFVAGQASYLAALGAYLVARRRHIDVLHIQGIGPHAAPAAWLAHRLGIPTVAKVASMAFGEVALGTRRLGALRQRGLKAFDAVVAITDEVARALVGDGVEPSRIVAIPNGVDLQPFARPAAETRRALRHRILPGVADDVTVILTMSRLDPVKGIDVLMASLEQLADRTWVLAIAGEGEARHALAAQADASGLGSRVRFLGRVERPEEVMAAADVFALPSQSEGLPNAVLEAMAASLPVVASRLPGVEELGDASMFVFATPGEVASWRDQLAAVLNDPAGRSQRAEAARARVAQRYGIDVVVDAYLRLYQTVRTAAGHAS